jgi:glycosyltransferase involved in cell wall biosynthesis
MLVNLLRWLKSTHDFDLRILAGKPGALLPEFAEFGEVDCFETKPPMLRRALRRFNLGRPRKRNTKYLGALRRALADCDIRLIYANSVASAEMLEFLSFLDCPAICHVHELEMSIRALARPDFDAMRVLEDRVNAYIAVSDAAKANLLVNHGVASDKVEVVLGPGPVAAQRKASSPRDVRAELGIPLHAKIACGCGTIEPRKGTDLFLEVAVHAARATPNAPIHFVWVGGQSKVVRSMRRRVASLGLDGVVHFVGDRLDVIPYFDASDVVLLTSREESLSLVMLEAALRQKPIFCFDRSGHPPEFVRDGAGVVVPAFNSSSMAEKLLDSLSNPALCQQQGKAARQKVLDQYDFNASAAKIGKTIEAVLQYGALSDKHVNKVGFPQRSAAFKPQT